MISARQSFARTTLGLVFLAGVAGAGASVDTGGPDENAGFAVAESFDPQGAFDAVVKDPLAGPSPASAADWPFRLCRADVESRVQKRASMALAIARLRDRGIPIEAPDVPNYYIFQGQPMTLELDGTRLAIRIAGGAERARAVAAEAGIALLDRTCPTVKDWVLLPLAQPIAGTRDARAKLELLLKSPEVLFASPVFHSAAGNGGWTVITAGVLARVAPTAVGSAQQVAAGAAPDLEHRGPLGRIPMSVRLRLDSRNGLDVLARANALALDPRFAWAEPDVLEASRMDHIPNDPSFASCWGAHNTGQVGGTPDADMDGPEAWDITTGRATVLAAVLDNGCQVNHPDLNVSALSRDFTEGDVNGTGDGSPGNSCDDHGTAVAGMISMRIDNALGGAGIAPDCPTLHCKVSDNVNDPPTCSNSFGAYSPSWVVNALAWAGDNGCRVTNMSFNAGNYQSIIDAVAAAYLTDNMVNFASTGNGGADQIGDPAIGFTSAMAYETAVGAMNRQGQRAGFSNFGTGLDLSAPGQNVYSTDRTGSVGYSSGDYAVVNGTSFASPSAAGCQVLFFSAYPFATQVEGLAALLGGAVDLGTAGYDTDFGYGFVNAFGAILDANPSNDFCADATVVSLDGSGSYNPAIRNTRWATPSRSEPAENCGSGGGNTASVYYRFTAPNSGLLSLNTNGSDYDTVMSIFDGCGSFAGQTFTQPSRIACDDDGGSGTNSQLVNVPVTVGQTYIIKVAKYGVTPGGGMLDFNLSFVATPPANDACSAATQIVNPGTGAFSYNPSIIDTELATTVSCEPDETCGAPAGNSNSVYFRFSPAHQGTITLDTFGSNYDTVLSIHSGCTTQLFQLPPNPPICLQPSRLACNDDSSATLQSQIAAFPVTGGSSYLVKVANYGSPGPGALDFNFSFSPFIPPNDACADATVIPPVSGTFHPPAYDAFFAGVDACEAAESCVGSSSHSVWYEFTPPVNGRATISTAGSNYDTVLAVFAGCSASRGGFCTAPAQLACNDDANATLQSLLSSVPMAAGQNYKIKIARFGSTGDAGVLDFSFTFTPNCAADFNGDGNLDPDDLSDYITCFFTAPPCPAADFNADGNIDPDDLSDYITAFFQGC